MTEIRCTKDKTINTEGKIFLEKVEEKKIGHILNGNIDGDKEGEFTCTRARGENNRLCSNKHKSKREDWQVSHRRQNGIRLPANLCISTTRKRV